ncbi:MAG: hypothetical protein WB463_17655, partial [Pseudolabrys sp.]
CSRSFSKRSERRSRIVVQVCRTEKSAALGPRHERNSAIVIAVWHGVRYEKRRAKLQLVAAPLCAMVTRDAPSDAVSA